MLTLYENYYKLTADPFRLSPDHRFSFGHRSYARAKAYLEYALHRGEGFITITGAAGTGKTTLINQMLSEIDRARIQVATLNSTQLEGRDLLEMVAGLFGLEHEDTSKASLLLEIEEFVKRLSQKGRRALLIVDEAQGLTPSAVEELRQLANLHFNHRLLLQVFLVGQEQLRDMLKEPGMEHLRQRMVAASHLASLSLDETISYIEHRLLRVGWQGDPEVTEGALRLIHRYSRGVPRRINLICSRLFLYGSMEQKHELGDEDARAVIEDMRNEFLVPGEEADPADAEPAIPEPQAAETGEEPPLRHLPRRRLAERRDAAGEADVSAALERSGAAGLDAKAGLVPGTDAAREGEIWGEIEQLERELVSTSREMDDDETLRVAGGGGRRAVRHPARNKPGAGGARQQNAVGLAVTKAMAQASAGAASPGVSTRPAAKQDTGGRRRGGLKPVREAAPRVPLAKPVPPEADERGGEAVPEAGTLRGASRAERGPRDAARPRSGRLGGWLLGVLVIALGLALGIGLDSYNREHPVQPLDPENTGTIRRDVTESAQSELASVDPALARPDSVTVTGEPDTVAAPPATQSASPESAAAGPAAPAEPPFAQADRPDAPLSTLVGEGTALEQNEAQDPTGSADSGLAAEGRADAAAAQSNAPVSGSPLAAASPAGMPPGAASERSSDAAPGQTLSASAAQSQAGASSATTELEAERARLQREAEQRFEEQLREAEAAAVETTRAARQEPPEPRPASRAAPAAIATAKPARSVRTTVSPNKAAAASVTPDAQIAPSRPKIGDPPQAVAVVRANTVTAPVQSPQEVRLYLLKGQWTSQGKPATLLPSDVTFCSAAGATINCWSAPQNTDTRYGKALYKVEATLNGFDAQGNFRLSYRTLVKLIGAPEGDRAAMQAAADDDSGWQKTERSMSCQLKADDSVMCRSDTGTVREYRRPGGGKRG